jgi:hypothetical protein
MPSLGRRIFSEWLGAAFLLAAVVGSGIMAQKLAGGNVALALLCNTIPIGAILVVLILIFGPLSGAHFNPAVTLAFARRSYMGHCGYLCCRSDRRWHRGRMGGALDVRASGLAIHAPSHSMDDGGDQLPACEMVLDIIGGLFTHRRQLKHLVFLAGSSAASCRYLAAWSRR